MKQYKLLFADLDGTLIEPITLKTFPQGIWDMKIKFDVLDKIKELNPDAEIVMLIPTLSYLINMDQLSNEYNFGEGTIDDYISVMKSVAECEGAIVVNMQEAWTLTKENWSDYLVDGSHLKKTARREYADFLAQKLYELFAK